MRAGWSLGVLLAGLAASAAAAAPPTSAQKAEFDQVCMSIAHNQTLCGCKAEAAPRLIDSDFMAVVIASMKGRPLDPKYAAAYNTYVAKSNQICKPDY